uniref:ATP-dependent Clp protease proteolytic subunit n=1 Tax=Cyphia glandulifera TaxID=2041119 RepID=A0A291F4G2_9ASTR|nr:ATP-dependent protease proteolytic subunit [Cyphia glandulifera]ATG26991.1 ATP-dependent protease proteolytic subunit [Cyphia glandulifera]
MPVGVPKVPYKIPVPNPYPESEDKDYDDDDDREESVDLYDRLHQTRSLFLFQELSDEIANNILGIMAFLNIDDNTKDQFLFINSPGGGLINGLAVYDMIQVVLPDVHTLCVGEALSIAALILTGGADTKRIAFPHSHVMIHQPRSSLGEGSPDEVYMDREYTDILRNDVEDLYVQRTRQPRSVIREDMNHRRFMTATEAKDYGIVDSL